MKYLLLVCNDDKKLEAMPKDDFDAFVNEHLDCDDALRKSGHFLASDALQPVTAATTVRVRGGRVSLTDGPFAETKEQVGGFYLIEARDLNDAIHVAARIPSARTGCIEVRPILELART
jgi:hypothetical protein